MNNLIWLLRASKWARRPPSEKAVKFVFAIIGLGLLLVLIEWLGYWPEWATLDQGRAPRLPR